MPVIIVNRIFNSDISKNPECFYVYMENEKKEGGEVYRRSQPNCLPITIKKAPSMSREAYWSDDEYAMGILKIQKEIDILREKLDKGATVIVEENFLSSETNSPMSTQCPKIKESILNSFSLLFNQYRPKNVKS
jgi:hypothetical protein